MQALETLIYLPTSNTSPNSFSTPQSEAKLLQTLSVDGIGKYGWVLA